MSVAGLVGLLSLTALIAPSGASAQTAGSCSGHLTFRQAVYLGNTANPTHPPTMIGELRVYYSPGAGGTNTACFYHRGPAVGVSSRTSVTIEKCRESVGNGKSPCTKLTTMTDPDVGTIKSYSKFAGPVRVIGTNRHCVYASGYLFYQGKPYRVQPTGRFGCS